MLLPQKESQMTGQVISPQKRATIAREFKKSHFQFGQNTLDYKSSTQTHFSPTHLQQQMNLSPTSNLKNTEIKMRKSNFSLGESRFIQDVQTTQKASYQQPPAGYKPQVIDAQRKADLRRSHWNNGGYGQIKLSVNDLAYAKRSVPDSPNEKLSAADKIIIMRGHHFNFGNQPMNYESTNKQRYLDFSGQQKDASAKLPTHILSDLRKHHFDLGSENAPMTTTQQIDYAKKQAQMTKSVMNRNDFQKTNIHFGEGSIPRNTTNQTIYQAHTGVSPDKMDEQLRKNLRKTHFLLGQHSSSYDSANQQYGAFRSGKRSELDEKMKTKLLQSSIELGDKQLGHAYFSTQNQFFSTQAQKQKPTSNERNQNNTKSFQSNFQLGGNNNSFQGQTQTQSTFYPQDAKQAQPNKEFEKHLRANHFSISHTNQNNSLQYESMQKTQFQPAGDISQYRGVLNVEKKNDLRKNHFEYGDKKQDLPLQSTTQAYFIAPIQGIRSDPSYRNNAATLKHKSFKLATEGQAPSHFTTNTQLAYKWVQPEFV